MNLTRTTVRLEPTLKKAAELKALELDMTFQDLFTQALKTYLDKTNKKKAQKLIFMSQPMGAPLDNLTREDLYAD
jgi:hypothetical protein